MTQSGANQKYCGANVVHLWCKCDGALVQSLY